MDTISKALSASLPVPKQVAIGPASVDEAGRIVCSVGYILEDGTEVHAVLKRPASKEVARGVVAIVNGLREAAGATDDTPYAITAQEAAQVLFEVALGKR